MTMEIIYTGLRYLNIGDTEEVVLSNGLTLEKPNPFLLSGRMRYAQSGHQFEEAEKASHYLVYRYEHSPVISSQHAIKDPYAMFYGGLMALQIVKPISTLGFVYSGTDYGGPTIHAAIESQPPMESGEWARLKRFDEACLSEAIALTPRVQAALMGSSVPEKNAITTLQLGMQIYAFHRYIAGLLWVVGMEAIFDSQNRDDFSEKLCRLLGPDTPVFPRWADVESPPSWTVKEVAIHLYTLRSKLAHGVDLGSAATDRRSPVDLLKIVRLHEYSQSTNYSMLLSEAACYLLCRVIQKSI